MSVRIAISDSGSGISPEKRAQLFRPRSMYVDGQSTVEGEGWGYGLWSSRLFIRSLGGSLFLDDVPRNGTRVIIDIPLKPLIRERLEGNVEFG